MIHDVHGDQGMVELSNVISSITLYLVTHEINKLSTNCEASTAHYNQKSPTSP